jgi:hypothetical protein
MAADPAGDFAMPSRLTGGSDTHPGTGQPAAGHGISWPLEKPRETKPVATREERL